MADRRKTKSAQDANRIAEWLVDNSAEFEQAGIGQDKLAAAVGISENEVTEAVDYLENREEVVRWPQALTTPPRFLLKPGRIWPETRDEVLKKRSS
jgi:hypothetical protein